MCRDPGYPSRKHPVLTMFEQVPEPWAPEQWEPDWRNEWKGQGHTIPNGEAEGKDRGRNPFYNTRPTTEEPPQTYGEAEGKDRGRNPFYNTRPTTEEPPRTYGEAEGKDRGRNPFYNTRPTTEEPPRTYGEAEGEDRGWNPFYNTRPTTGEPPPTTPLKIGPLSYSAPARVKYYTHTPIQKRGGEYHSSQGVGTNSETTKHLLKLMPDRQPRESEKDYQASKDQTAGAKAQTSRYGKWHIMTTDHRVKYILNTSKAKPMKPPKLQEEWEPEVHIYTDGSKVSEEELAKWAFVATTPSGVVTTKRSGYTQGTAQTAELDEDYQHIWPLISIREVDHLMPYSPLVASTPEDTRRNPDRGIIRLSRKLFYHLPTRKRQSRTTRSPSRSPHGKGKQDSNEELLQYLEREDERFLQHSKNVCLAPSHIPFLDDSPIPVLARLPHPAATPVSSTIKCTIRSATAICAISLRH
ncbi:unnamed protein product [Gadus morhua 'NCC']